MEFSKKKLKINTVKIVKIFTVCFIIFILLNMLSYKLFYVSILRVFGLDSLNGIYVRAVCIGKNKQFMTWGFLSNPVCATVYPDEGKPCSASSQCMSGLCVLTENNRTPRCRGYSSDYPLCVTVEATVENYEELKNSFFGPFMFCD